MPDALESRLHALAEDATFPPTPDLAANVGAALRSRRRAPPPAPAPRRRRTLALALAAALLLPAAAIAAVPGARDRVLDWLGLRGVSVKRVATTPRAGPSAGLDLGRPVTLRDPRVRFTPLAPAELGRPAGVFAAGSPPGGRISLTYARAPACPRSLPASEPS